MTHRLKITDTTLRDGHQSLWATRMATEDMLPILEKLDHMGYHSLEVWGGATFDVCLRFLNEDPWERLRLIKKHVKNTPLQMLLRGQSLLGYMHYPDDVLEAFIHKTVENGINIIRIFDALNDIRNIEKALQVTKRAGAHAQATVVYTVSPVHTTEHYLETALRLEEMGADSICIKDMAGLLAPFKAYELVKLFKANLNVPVHLHCHYIGGMAVGAYLKAAEAGVDVVDTASVPMAFGASQPPVETVVRALKGTPYDTGLSIKSLFEVAQYFENLRKELGQQRGVTRINDMRVFEHQVPGGMISNLVSQLEQQKALHRLDEVLEEIPRVREELGYPPLVTPTSQIVGTQAVLNVLTGQRYKMIPGEVKMYVEGWYGQPPATIDPSISRKVLGDKEPITCRPADLLEPKMDKLREEIKDLAISQEDVLSYAMFPQVARKFFEARKRGETGPQRKAASIKPGAPADANGAKSSKEAKNVNLSELKELIKVLDQTDITEIDLESDGVKVSIRKGGKVSASGVTVAPVAEAAVTEKAKTAEVPPVAVAAPAPQEAVSPATDLVPVTAPMVGTFYQAPAPDAPPFVKVGDTVKPGQPLCIIEAMKLMNEIEAEVAGEIVEVLVENGQPVEYGQKLFLIRKK
ncbi:acetyl-CoA carboxylase biotin carboxyl carrier protein [Desulforamulus ferrireducens]|uniref:Acetyl-CoA carboxylase, biotin carboxyl carrier protein n=1 Tax=Desulforamulus ferrireducens TaxID=1833852 RepID=A0A1S6IUN7_9FIRM|nr:acetyl-CoA carboxylase biotin carboxyl carrier protein [Desulforamulus ferrireducens]AQS58500.1 acetyl-CoA carboxylase, biotin carboxyl carrier protein [Desulforamulus ferrireducens]